MIPRDAEKTIHTMLRGFPIVTITGPKQSGKTTLARAIFTDKPYASLEDPDIRLFARNIPPSTWFSAYTTTYVERDVRQILQIQDLETFQRFIRLCAGRTGQLLNFSSLASECGITHNTAKAWISVMEASYILFLLRPHHVNFKKRLVKMPKLYFYDVGLASWLLGIRTAEHITTHPLRGALFETFIISELIKSRLNRGERPDLYFWRDSNGNEVDVIAEQNGKLRPIEIKSGKTLSPESTKGLKKWLALAQEQSTSPMLIYGGEESYKHEGIQITGWHGLIDYLDPRQLPRG